MSPAPEAVSATAHVSEALGAPLYVAWQITNERNLACLHCIEESGSGKAFRDELDRDEVFHILEGSMRIHIDGMERIAHAGETVLAPKGKPHSFRVESRDGARCLTITTGGDFENMIREMAEPALDAGFPPKVEPTPAMIIALYESCARNGIDIVGAPLS